jgi:hypothetical protein
MAALIGSGAIFGGVETLLFEIQRFGNVSIGTLHQTPPLLVIYSAILALAVVSLRHHALTPLLALWSFLIGFLVFPRAIWFIARIWYPFDTVGITATAVLAAGLGLAVLACVWEPRTRHDAPHSGKKIVVVNSALLVLVALAFLSRWWLYESALAREFASLPKILSPSAIAQTNDVHNWTNQEVGPYFTLLIAGCALATAFFLRQPRYLIAMWSFVLGLIGMDALQSLTFLLEHIAFASEENARNVLFVSATVGFSILGLGLALRPGNRVKAPT